MRHFVAIVITVIFLVSCSEEDVNVGQIAGTWGEEYDSSVFAFDGILQYTFDGNGSYTLYTSDPSGNSQHTVDGSYSLDTDGSNTITLNPQATDNSNITYVIVKLNSTEMAWQKLGTTDSHGSWGSDYRHFVRIK